MPRVRLVVLNYEGGERVVRCLDALHRLEQAAVDLEIVVVDNASTDRSPDQISERFPDVRLIRRTTNGGFPANNDALRDLEGVDYVGLVNNDAYPDPGYLGPLVAALDADPGLGAAGAKLVFAEQYRTVRLRSEASPPGGRDARLLGVEVTGVHVDGADRLTDALFVAGHHGWEFGPSGVGIWSDGAMEVRLPDGAARLRLAASTKRSVALDAGGCETSTTVGPDPRWVDVPSGSGPETIVQNAGSVVLADGSGADRGFGEPDHGQYDESTEVFAWCGGAVLLRPDYLADVGLFDERFFLYYEDTDLSWRGRARGWRYLVVPESVVRHDHATSTGETSPIFQHYVERNRLAMLTKNAPGWFTVRAVGRYVRSTASYARRDVIAPFQRGDSIRTTAVRRRMASLAAYASMAPALLAERRRLRRAQTVADADLVRWLGRR